MADVIQMPVAHKREFPSVSTAARFESILRQTPDIDFVSLFGINGRWFVRWAFKAEQPPAASPEAK